MQAIDLNELVAEQVEQKQGNQISPEITDEELIKIIDSDIGSVENTFRTLDEVRQANERYWAGDQIDKSKIKKGDAEIFVNRILVSQETVIPIVTQEVPPPWIIVTPKNKRSKKVESKLGRHLRDLWEYDVKMQYTMEVLARIYFNSRVGFLKPGFDTATKKITTDNVMPDRVRFDIHAPNIDRCRFFAEYITEPISDVMRKFPDKKAELQKLADKESAGTRSELTYVEYWGRHVTEENKPVVYVCWKFNKTVLGKNYNSLWNKSTGNHFDFPRMPYIPLNSLSMGKSMIDGTSITEQAIPLQDLLNKRKRQIDRNASFSNGKVVSHAGAMDKATFDSINPGTDKIYLSGDVESVQGGFAVVTGRAMESGIFEDMQDTKNEIDNLFGAHATLRGERTAFETKGGRELLKQGSLGRQETLRRSYEQVAEEVYNWWIQLMYVFYDKPRFIVTAQEPDKPEDQLRVTNNTINPNEDTISKADLKGLKIKAIVKSGTTRPKDPEGMRADAITIRQTGNMNPLTFFEMMGVDNPRREARREYLWQQPEMRAMMFPELQGDGMIDPQAIMHITDINSGMVGAEEDVLGEVDTETMQKHVMTHINYMQGIDIDEDLEPYDALDLMVQESHKAHIAVEKGILQQMFQREQSMMVGQENTGEAQVLAEEQAATDQLNQSEQVL